MYRVELGGRTIGETKLETADPPMGVVGGRIEFQIDENPFELIKRHCEESGATINDFDSDLEYIDTQTIDDLRIYRADGREIEGIAGGAFSGFREEGYYVTILGVPYPFYAEEFPHHCDAYDNQFK